eukprot:snap_masked-scaffold487_size158652-processed-gene-0.30 protein:Tk00183 transcript:snap_masked-scaffold487_size158652-processed-gene-0.30-mRNA-1 annotation:"hypothetical protein DAPPUDRAFT_202746"
MDPIRTKLAFLALYSRLFIILLSILANILIPDHDAGVFQWTITPSRNESTSWSDLVVDFLADGLTRWDGQYFLHIANNGYTYENTLAFFPLYPMCVRVAAEVIYWAQVDYRLLHFSSALKLGAVAINVLFFTLATLALFELSRKVLKDEKLAYRASVFFCINPASIFFTAAYSESLHALLSFYVMLKIERSFTFQMGILLPLSTAVRSNAVLNLGFAFYRGIKGVVRELVIHRRLKQLGRAELSETIVNIIGDGVIPCVCSAFVSLLPFVLFQWFAFTEYCGVTKPRLDFDDSILSYGQLHQLKIPDADPSLWCHAYIPIPYSFVQSHYWDVGFLRYFQLKQIPNFILACPIFFLLWSQAWRFWDMPYVGDLMNEAQILKWISDEIKRDEIKAVSRSVLDRLLQKFHHLGVIFVDDESQSEVVLIHELETFHDEFNEAGLTLIQVDDPDYEQELGLFDLPALVHFKENIPCLFTGDETKEAILEWMTLLSAENVIENVTSEMLSILREDEEYLGVFFSGECFAEDCQELLEILEEIDDDLDQIGIHFVRTSNVEFAQNTLDLQKIPALGLYRNGHWLHYIGSLDGTESIKRWFLSHGNLKVKDQIEKVNTRMLQYLYETDDKLVVLFYSEGDRDSDEIIQSLEHVDQKLDKLGIAMVRNCDPGTELQYGITELPTLVYIKSGIPGKFLGDLMDHDAAFKWIRNEANTTRMHEVNDIVLTKLVEKFTHIAAVFYDMEEDPIVENLQSIAPDCRESDIAIVMIQDDEEVSRLGLTDLPKLVFFHTEIPSVMTANIGDPDETFDFLQKHKSSSFIEEVTDNMLSALIGAHEYVAVYFRGDVCQETAPTEVEAEDSDDTNGDSEQDKAVNCDQVLAELETIDDELDDIGIIIVTTNGFEVANDNGVSEFPALGLFRNGHFIAYPGNQDNEKQILKWLTDEDTLKIIGIIDEVNDCMHLDVYRVNLAMLENILTDQNDAFVFFYNEFDAEAHMILEELEQIDEKLDKQDLTMVKISDVGSHEVFGIESLPALVYFENGVPLGYQGDLFNDKAIMKWMKTSLKQEDIKNVSTLVLNKLIERGRTMAVLFYEENGEIDAKVLKELENIDDDCARFEISFVMVSDEEEARNYGIDVRPGLLYFENKIPSLYDGDLMDEEALLSWLIEQKTSDTIEEVTEVILEKLVLEEEYVAVFFSGPCQDDDPCTAILRLLETIDSIIHDLGIMLVTTEDRGFARLQEVRGFPSLGMFKNGDYVHYEGDLYDQMMILSWISDKDTLEVADKIPMVNENMLKHLIRTEAHLLAFLFKAHSNQDHTMASKMEQVRENKKFQAKHINLVKCSDKDIEKTFGIGSMPALVHFSRGIPLICPEDLSKEKKVLPWIMNTTELEEIEEISAPILDVLIEQKSHLVVIFFDKGQAGEDDLAFIKAMESVDDDCDALSISMVKIHDNSKALEFGLEATPAVIYFKDRVPTLCPPDHLGDVNVTLQWIQDQKRFTRLSHVSDELLERIIHDFEYVVVLFLGRCSENSLESCIKSQDEAIQALEEINDELTEMGYVAVLDFEVGWAKEAHNLSDFPTVALFKNGILDKYPGPDFKSCHSLLSWLSDVETIEILGQIEHLSRSMLRYMVEMNDDLLVFFHELGDKHVEDILERVASVDDNLESERVTFVRCSSPNAIDDYALTMKPSIVYFKRGVPIVYVGDLKNDDSVLGWVTKELQSESIPPVRPPILDSILERVEFAAILYMDSESAESLKLLSKLTPLDEECKMHDIVMAMIIDPDVHRALGVDESVALVYYENNIPFLYRGDLNQVDALKQWLIYQRNTASIEEVTDDMIAEIVEENEFVAVLYLGLCEDDDEGETEKFCDTVVQNLETIDNALDEFGIVLVLTREIEKAHEQWISRFPAIGYYRNGDFIRYPADVSNSRAVLRWLTSIKTMDLLNRIIRVNSMTLDKLINREKVHLFVFFYEERDLLADRVLRQLEDIDDDLPNSLFFKISDVEGIMADYDLEHFPTLVHFQHTQKSPFHGDLQATEAVVAWLYSQLETKPAEAQP